MMRPSQFQSPASSNYDRLTLNANPRVRRASNAFGLDYEAPQQTPPNLRNTNFQMMGNHNFSGEQEPNYCEVLEDSPHSTPTISQGPGAQAGRNDMDFVDVDRVSETISRIGETFGLSTADKLEVQKIYEQPNNFAREVAKVCFFRSQLARLEDTILERNMTSTTTGPQAIPPDHREAKWQGTNSVRLFIRNKIKDALLSSSIQAYASNFTTTNDPILDSLENHIVEIIKKEVTKVPNYNLPEGFREEDPSADTAVRKVIKEIAKSERCRFREHLLNNIINPPMNSKVMKIFDLLYDLVLKRPRNYKKTPTDVWTNTSVPDKARITLLRLEATLHVLQPKDATQPLKGPSKQKSERSMWEKVDERLTWIRGLSPDHQKLFYHWIVQYDAKIFTGAETFQQIKERVRGHIHILNPEEFAKWIIEGCN
ncbi:uncharacterized protein MELLADRAFT_88056 [Melampsora larici-populina 98AG31]|uniref:Uncharacterized protein n=1 Tax=Melampsora larici-populina (strain 98AG31 / pathotype 3-4-7) TaxID=747676 RepID=F4RQA1_MELLP|nr:uncharacterized protein MELLADRAFT_88056 [Melampsora larici-populina 98AG31]EGG05369.1 hypothetical protein MELLADRAFT_88056 [Melampsora larici-populina 98AG31]